MQHAATLRAFSCQLLVWYKRPWARSGQVAIHALGRLHAQCVQWIYAGRSISLGRSLGRSGAVKPVTSGRTLQRQGKGNAVRPLGRCVVLHISTPPPPCMMWFIRPGQNSLVHPRNAPFCFIELLLLCGRVIYRRGLCETNKRCRGGD